MGLKEWPRPGAGSSGQWVTWRAARFGETGNTHSSAASTASPARKWDRSPKKEQHKFGGGFFGNDSGNALKTHTHTRSTWPPASWPFPSFFSYPSYSLLPGSILPLPNNPLPLRADNAAPAELTFLSRPSKWRVEGGDARNGGDGARPATWALWRLRTHTAHAAPRSRKLERGLTDKKSPHPQRITFSFYIVLGGILKETRILSKQNTETHAGIVQSRTTHSSRGCTHRNSRRDGRSAESGESWDGGHFKLEGSAPASMESMECTENQRMY